MDIIKLILNWIAPEAKALLKLAKMLRVKPKKIIEVAKSNPAKVMKKIDTLPLKQKKEFSTMAKDIMTSPEFKKEIDKLSTKQKRSYAAGAEATVKSPKDLSVELGNMTAKERKKFSEVQSKATKIDQTRALSSSWITKGHYSSVSLGSGDLTIWTKKSGKSYTYPGVPVAVWNAMRLARGQNGSGAGSVFWALYLRGYKKSFTGQLLSKLGQLTGVETPTTDLGKLRN